MDVERLEAVKREIQRRPAAETDLNNWHSYDPFSPRHCIGGWAQALFSPRWLDRVLAGRFIREVLPIGELCALLGMEYWQAITLFNNDNWPTELHMAYIFAGDLEERKGVVVTAIDRFISGNGSWAGEVREREVAGI